MDAAEPPALDSAVGVTVVDVGVMRVPVQERRVGVLVHMRLSHRILRAMRVPVVLVVAVPVRVLQGLVHVVVLMPLSQVQPEPQPHEECRQQKQGVTGSRKRARPATAPTKGASEK
jgi:hypothetical protein